MKICIIMQCNYYYYFYCIKFEISSIKICFLRRSLSLFALISETCIIYIIIGEKNSKKSFRIERAARTHIHLNMHIKRPHTQNNNTPQKICTHILSFLKIFLHVLKEVQNLHAFFFVVVHIHKIAHEYYSDIYIEMDFYVCALQAKYIELRYVGYIS
jgi:hypothetical protein